MELLDLEFSLVGFILFLALTVFVFWIAKKKSFFHLPSQGESLPPVTFKQTLGAFLTYALFSFIVLPLVLVFFGWLKTGQIGKLGLSAHTLSWVQIGALWLIFFLLVLYLFLIRKESRNYIFWATKEKSFSRAYKGFGMGIVAWFVSYPFVLLVSLIIKYVSNKIWGPTDAEQVAVKYLKSTMDSPVLFGAMILTIVVIVPFTEELLFRGFLQNFIKRHLGRNWAIGLTALLFSLAHFSLSQGMTNVQLLTSLFLLALFISFIYEREGTLWAPVGLHVIFNAWNVLLIALSAE